MENKNKLTIILGLAVIVVIAIFLLATSKGQEGGKETADNAETVTEEQPKEDTQESEVEVLDEGTSETGDTASSDEGEEVKPQGGSVKVNIPESEITDNIMNFKTVSVNDEDVTSDIFSKYDITVVHVWGTFCSPCIAEMPDYAAFYKELPSNVNLIGVVIDANSINDSEVEEAKEILSNAGAEFTNILASDDVNSTIESIMFVPSSFFVDSNGSVIGEIMDGASFEQTKNRLEGYLER
ncbi:MAG: TlpA family protein disulfide reductase [Lachnospiraceae bacterium]|nr:TlpA family protein disulfide reductase [Lachnospiraceae bacterium]